MRMRGIYVKRLRGMCNPLPFERIRGLGGIVASCLVVKTVEEWDTFLSRGLKAFACVFLHTQHDKLGRSRSPTMHCILLVL